MRRSVTKVFIAIFIGLFFGLGFTVTANAA